MLIIRDDTAVISYFTVQLIWVSAANVSSMILVEVFQFVVDIQWSRDSFIEGEVNLFEGIHHSASRKLNMFQSK